MSTGNRKPTTFSERQYNKSSIGVSSTYSYYKNLAIPLLYPFQYKHPEKVGTTAYVFSFRPAKNSQGDYFHSGGIPIDIKILKDNPIFADYNKDKLTVRWWGGQALWPQKNPDRKVKICAKYSDKELHEQERTRIHAWRYTGGLIGLIQSLFKSMEYANKEDITIFDAAMFSYYLAKEWELTDKIIESDIAKRPCLVTEEYPNKNKGRICLCTLHPEYMVWWDGHIEENKQKDICLADGLYQWKDVSTLKKPIDNNLTHTWWLVRRLTAWASKIPDEDMPPIEKEKVKKEDLEKIENILFWDGSMLNQMECI